jgi:hypothetical protein
MQFLADFMQPTFGEKCHVGGVHVTRGDQYHPEGMQLHFMIDCMHSTFGDQ